MTAQEIERFRRIEEIFDAALAHPAGPQRDAFFNDRERTDSGLLDEVRTMLEDLEQVRSVQASRPEPFPQFGAWQATRLLGKGGMGTVYLAERADGAFQMLAAVKVVPLALASPDIEERFRRERQFLAGFDHPKVARLIDGGITPLGLPYLVMEFVDGMTIDQYCNTGGLDTRARIGLMRQVLEALAYVHERRVMHRDLKPSNILVAGDGNVKLLDFGTARLIDASGDNAITKTGVFAFTPEYASPEQMTGKPLAFSSDIYSAGVLLGRLLNIRPPYAITPKASGLDSDLCAILTKALRKNPAERYQSATEMDADLGRYLEGKNVLARDPARWKPRALVAAAVLALGATGVGRLLHHPSPPQGPVSLAVLFNSASGNQADQYFANALAQEVSSELARWKKLRVEAQPVLAGVPKQPRDIRATGIKLNVSHLLDASVERVGDHVRIVASLERAADGARLWTNTYQRPTADLGAIEVDLEAGIASALGMAPRAPLHVPPELARDHLLKARFESDQMTPAANALAQRDFRQALEIDPNYAAAYQGLASAIWNRNIWAGERPVMAERRECEKLYQKAIQVDPDFLPARVSLGLFAMQYDWDWKRAEREFQTVLAAGPNVGAEDKISLLYLILGRRAESDEHMRRAQDLDSTTSLMTANFEQSFYLEGRLAEAREECRKLAARNPAAPQWQIELNFLDASLGQWEPAIQNLRKLSKQRPAAQLTLAQAEAAAGHSAEALRIVRPLEQSFEKGKFLAYNFAAVYAAMGDESNAVKWLQRSMDEREMPAFYIHVDPVFAKMQDRPAFHELKKQMNLDW